MKEVKGMKKALVLAIAAMMLVSLAALVSASEKTRMDLNVGDEVYACNCGEACPCNTMSKMPGQCTCGKDMIKAKAVKVGEGTADLMAEGWEKARTFKTVGKYACAVGPQSPCSTISQNPGKCPCGWEMKEVK
jgi:hypothetical protein